MVEFEYSDLKVDILPDPRGAELRFWQDPKMPPGDDPIDFSLIVSVEGLQTLRDLISEYLEDS